jgi:SAM-dependent methyltransferase
MPAIDRIILDAQINPLTKYMKGLGLDVGGEKAHSISGWRRPDISWKYLNIGSRYKPDILGSAEAIPVSDSTFDTVLMLEILEHLREPEKALDEVHRVLKPNGRLFLSAPFLYRHHRNPVDYQRWTHEKLFEEIEVKRKLRIEVFLPRGAWLSVLLSTLTIGLGGISRISMGSKLLSVLGKVLSRCIVITYPLWKVIDDYLAKRARIRGVFHRFTIGYLLVARKHPDDEELIPRSCPDVLKYPVNELD